MKCYIWSVTLYGYGAYIWTVRGTDHKSIERFETWCWRSPVTNGSDRLEEKHKDLHSMRKETLRPAERRKDTWTGHVLRRELPFEVRY